MKMKGSTTCRQQYNYVSESFMFGSDASDVCSPLHKFAHRLKRMQFGLF
jgi:hypothetical protein